MILATSFSNVYDVPLSQNKKVNKKRKEMKKNDHCVSNLKLFFNMATTAIIRTIPKC